MGSLKLSCDTVRKVEIICFWRLHKQRARGIVGRHEQFVSLFVRGKFHTGLLKKNEKNLARFFNFTFRYIDDVISLNNVKFCDFVDRIYPTELEILLLIIAVLVVEKSQQLAYNDTNNFFGSHGCKSRSCLRIGKRIVRKKIITSHVSFKRHIFYLCLCVCLKVYI